MTKNKQLTAFTLAEGSHRLLLNGDDCAKSSPRLVKWGFTLAEVLITLGVIGVVAALTMPTLMTNIQERVRKEQVRTVKYKLTKATEKMNSLDKIGPYANTEAFVNELKKHLSIAKVCDKGHLTECWPTTTINTPNATRNVSELTSGTSLMALALGTGGTDTVGIVTGDGTPMIMVYSPKCTPLDPAKSYTWSVVDGKPETNATTNCISAIFDINGAKGPNKIGTDVRTLNSLFGYKRFTVQTMSKEDCLKQKDILGINGCSVARDTWAGAVKACHDIGLHLPSMQTLANLAGARYGRTDIGPYTLIMKNNYSNGTKTWTNCRDYYTENNWSGRVERSDQIICVNASSIPTDTTSAVKEISDGYFWSSTESGDSTALRRDIDGNNSSWFENGRSNADHVPLCVGD